MNQNGLPVPKTLETLENVEKVKTRGGSCSDLKTITTVRAMEDFVRAAPDDPQSVRMTAQLEEQSQHGTLGVRAAAAGSLARLSHQSKTLTK
jgi:hypothetical protein